MKKEDEKKYIKKTTANNRSSEISKINKSHKIDKELNDLKKDTIASKNNKKSTTIKKSIKKNDKELIDLAKDIEKDIGISRKKKLVTPVKVKDKTTVKANDLKDETKKKKSYKKNVEKTKKIKRTKLNVKNISLVFLALICFIAMLLFGIKKYQEYKKEQADIAYQKALKQKLEDIKKHYNEFVITNKDTELYELKDNTYEKIGSIKEGVELALSPIEEINSDTNYFYIESLELYVPYQDVEIIENLTEQDKRYEKYIVFNENIITTSPTNFYDNEKVMISINKSFSLPIIIKDVDKYYVEYNNKLFYVKNDNIEKTIESNNTNESTNSRIRTIVYHFIYKNATEDDCHQIICHHVDQFDSHMKYISENKFLSLTMEEMEMFLDNKIRIPKKSVLVTIDDGWLAGNAIPILEKYQVNATLFLVTSWYKKENFVSDYLELHSHSNNLHNPYACKGGLQGGGILCLNKEALLNDLRTSREALNNTTAFCYPFYDYNDYAISVLKEAGFTMAFAGLQGTYGISTPTTDRFKLPRYTLYNSTTVDQLASILNY